jgi:signal transduction histidine kinase/CheY-like chemotaxis protein
MLQVFDILVQHDPRLALLALGVCLLASYTSFSMMTRLYAPRSRFPWVVATSVVTGCGAWATHSIALLAFNSGVATSYDVGVTVLSGVIAVAGCGVGYYVARASERMALGGALVGFAIGAMHYVGMMGVAFQGHVQGDILYFETAILTGASFGAAALSRAQLMPDLRGRVMGALLLTAGICGTQVIGIAGLTIVPDATITIPHDTLALVWFAIALTAVVLLILGLGVVGNLVDQHIQEIEVAKRNLESTLRAAEAANRAKSEFIATMSHELRTPLNAVIGFSEIMVNETYGPLGHKNYKEYVSDIHDSGSHLLRIINDILDVSKAEAGNLTLAEGEVDCGELIRTSCRLFRPRLQNSELTLDLRLQGRLPILQADARMVKQIILNLMANAVKFTPPGGHIAIEVEADHDSGLLITISDTGVGIAREDLDRVRQPFVQVDSQLNRRHEGTGLGLPLVDIMMRQHGGTFELHSEQGKGTTARVRFPASRLMWRHGNEPDHIVEAGGSYRPGTGLGEAAATEKPMGMPCVMVVEDDCDLCDLLRRMLERAGFSTVGANNGREAVALLLNTPVDLLITDMAMPEMDGVELMRVVRTERPDIPIITLSGVEDVMEYRRIAAHLGARIALLKPIAQADLVGAVASVLGTRAMDSDSEAKLTASA